MRSLALTALLLAAAGLPGASTALTIPLDDTSTFVGSVDGGVAGPGLVDGFPSGGSTGSITFEGDFAPNSTVQVTALEFSQQFFFSYACGGDICLPGILGLPISLGLEGPGSINIDEEGNASGELHVILSAQGVDAAATLAVSAFGRGFNVPGTIPTVVGAFKVQGTLQFDNPESPLAGLQGVGLVPEPALAALMVVTALAASLLVARRRRALSLSTR